MLELSVALKYLTPRWRQLSVSIISLISILVIALVVWLIVVFFSVTHGLEKNWVQKLIALTAPVRITPTDAYYNSYYYRVDGISADSNYNSKSIAEKRASKTSDPYDPSMDEEVPASWPHPLTDAQGKLKDPIKIAFAEAGKIPGVKAQDYEMTFSNVRLRLLRDMPTEALPRSEGTQNQSFISQSAYLGSFDPESHLLQHAVMPLSADDLNNVLSMLTVASDNIQEDNPDTIMRLDQRVVSGKLNNFFNFVEVKSLTVPEQGWRIPKELLPQEATTLQVCALLEGGRIYKLFVPLQSKEVAALVEKWRRTGVNAAAVAVRLDKGMIQSVDNDSNVKNFPAVLFLAGGSRFGAVLAKDSLGTAGKPSQVGFDIAMNLQGNKVTGRVPFAGLAIGDAAVTKTFVKEPKQAPAWLYRVNDTFVLPGDTTVGESVLLPKTFKTAGVFVGDRGYLSYMTPTASSVQEQRIPIIVSGFYDPGIIPMGGKFILTPRSVTTMIRSAQNQDDAVAGNGINIRFDDIARADEIKHALEAAFEREGIAPYFKVETYRQYEFTKDIIQQLHSEKNLFSLISFVIIIVACSNIISMLIILVNDKKMEIGILRTMGATSVTIAVIFAICGVIMGLLGSLIGVTMAVITLKNLDSIIGLISRAQGFDMFNPAFFGETMPTELSFDALVFVIGMTAFVSMMAGVVPAIKACLLKPSEILRAE